MMKSADTKLPPGAQLTFGDIPRAVLQDDDILLNPSVETEDEGRIRGQAGDIYHILVSENQQTRKLNRMSTSELSSMAPQYGARIFEIRRHLEKKGFTIFCEKGEGGENWYQIMTIEKAEKLKNG